MLEIQVYQMGGGQVLDFVVGYGGLVVVQLGVYLLVGQVQYQDDGDEYQSVGQ